MKNSKYNFLAFKLLINFAFTAAFVLQACDSGSNSKEAEQAGEVDNTIKVITQSMEFQSADTISSGWNTFEYANQSSETHFILFDKYPEGKYFEDTKKEVLPPFDAGMAFLNEGNAEEAMAAFGKLPEWYGEVVLSGGTGLISPGGTAISTINLDPGYYVMECYVKMPNGQFHVSMGMAKAIIVTNQDSGNEEPEGNFEIAISSTSGIVFEDSLSKGQYTFEVNFIDQIKHEHFMEHDVNLVRLTENANLEELESWMNWTDPKGLITPAPEGVTFLGGVNDMPAGSKGYFEVELTPGRYAFISEVPNSLSKNMLKEFVIQD